MPVASGSIRWAILLLGLSLAGCGFQLRGAAGVSDALQPLALECQPPSPELLCDALMDQLETSGVRLTNQQPATTLKLSGFRQERRANAITARASAEEFTIRQTVNVTVISANQVPLLAPDRVSASDTLRWDESSVLAKKREEQILLKEISQRLAQQILFRLAPLNRTRIEALKAEYRHPGADIAP